MPEQVDGSAPGRTRSRVMHELDASDGAVGVLELADRLEMHPNTVRFHLDALVDARLAERRLEPRHHRGRPKVLYQALSHSRPVASRGHRHLAEILAGQLGRASADPVDAARHAGREWGRSLARQPRAAEYPEESEAVSQVTDVLAEIGFRPQVVASRRRIDLHHCPFGDLVAARGEVVCAMHLGVIQGLLTELDAPIEAHRAEPFVNPHLCYIHVRARRYA
jgi:predicted ArsR family transcriptional regulator